MRTWRFLARFGVRIGSRAGRSTVVELREGTSLLLYTDGLVERRGVDIDRAIARMTEPGLSSRGRSLEDWTQLLLDELGASETDDTTLLAARIGSD